MESAAKVERLLKDERFAEAERLLDGLLASAPRDPELRRLRAVARHFQDGPDPQERRRRAAADLSAAVEAGRATYDEAAVQACSLLFHWAYKDEGDAALAAALAERPGDGAPAHYQRARFLEKFKRDFAAALAQVDRALAREPHWRSHLFRARLRVRAADYDAAAGDLDASLRLNPEARDAWLTRARLRMKLSEFAGAAADFERAFAVEPPASFEEWTETAQAHLENQEPRKAAEDLGRALGFFAEPPPDLLLRRAQARRRAQDLAGALEDAELALKADAGFEPARALKAELSVLIRRRE